MRKIPRLLPLIAIAIGGVALIRAVGVAPGLFDGARAWAEEAVQPDAVAASAPAICALSEEQLAEQAGLSPAELRVIQSLKDRRGELDLRDNDFATMLPLMVAAEQKLDARIAEMEGIKTEVAGLLGQLDAKDQAEVDRLVAVYSAMRPRDAAAVFVSLDDSVRLPVAAAMRPRSLAAILAQMPPAEARELTEKLARRFDNAALAARAAAATGDAPAPTPAASTPAAPPPVATQTAAPPPAPRPAANRPQPTRAAARPATQPASPPAGSAAATADGPRPYQSSGSTPAEPPAPQTAQPRQSVQ